MAGKILFERERASLMIGDPLLTAASLLYSILICNVFENSKV